jgi:hypothetical protein
MADQKARQAAIAAASERVRRNNLRAEAVTPRRVERVTLFRHKTTGHLTMTIQTDHGQRRDDYIAVEYVPAKSSR